MSVTKLDKTKNAIDNKHTEVLENILIQLKIMTMHLQILTDEKITERNVK